MKPAACRILRAGIFLVSLTAAAGAYAHAHLKQQQPAENAEVSVSPQQLTLAFSEGVEDKFSGVTLTGPNNSAVATGDAKRSPDDITRLVVPVKQTLAEGTYTVTWHVVSVDGHKTKGQYHFSVK